MHLQNGSRSLAISLLLFMMVSQGVHGHMFMFKYRNEPELLNAFFTTNDLKVGRVMPLYMGKTLFPSGAPEYLPKDQADSIPFSLSQLPYILNLFGFEQGSPQAISMKNTLTLCEAKADDAEASKSCVTSLESMLDFVHKVLGTNSASMLKMERPKLTKPFQNFTILEVERHATKSVGCHMLPYEYAVYYCHSFVDESNVYEITLKGEFDEAPIKSVAICHMDTSHEDPNHLVFPFLGIKAGDAGVGVCHVFLLGDFVWLPADHSPEKCRESSEVGQKSGSKIMSIVGGILG